MNESTTQAQTVIITKGTRLNMSEMLANSQYRAQIVSQRKDRKDRAAGFKSAFKLLRKVLLAAEANSPKAAEIADEITVLLLKELQAPAVRVRAALRYLELANNIEKASNPRSALIAARKAVIGVVLLELPRYVDGKGNPTLGNALKAKSLKSFKNCDLAEVDLARLMALMGCIQWVKDDCNTGWACKAADSLFVRPSWSTASITNIVNGVTNPNYKEWMDAEPETSEPPCLIPNAETVAAMEAARAGDLEEVGDISDLFQDRHSD